MATPGPVVVDLQAVQSPATRGRGIGRFALEWALAMERHHPDVVGTYLLNPRFAPPGSMEALLATGKVTYRSPQADEARVVHTLSPFDLSIPARDLLSFQVRPGVLNTAMVYDLIPGLDPDAELAAPIDRRSYRLRLEAVRGADHLFALSDATKRSLIETLALDEGGVTVIGAAPGARFVPPASRERARDHAMARFSPARLRDRFVLYPSGSHPRKNNEALIRAFSKLQPALLAGHQLVIVCELDESTINHYRVLASSLGIEDRVVVTGYVDDDGLLALYQGAELVCFPSLAEGYGLPIVEAFACGTPVIGSDRSPMRELLGADAVFDPASETAITAALNRALLDPARYAAHRDHSIDTWEGVACESASAFERLLGRRRAPRVRDNARRVAFVSPLPPAPSGVAAYSYRLVEALQRVDNIEVDAFVEGDVERAITPSAVRRQSVRSLIANEALLGRYDAVVYSMGNSHHHLGALAMLRKRPGIVISHDVRLSNLYRHENGDPGFLPGGFARAIHSMYGESLPPSLGLDGVLSQSDLDRYGVLMAREVIGLSTHFLVTSTAGAALACSDAGPSLCSRVSVMPFALESLTRDDSGEIDFVEQEPDVGAVAQHWGADPRACHATHVIAHFGIVDPSKSLDLLIDSFATVKHDDSVLVFVGPVSQSVAREIATRCGALGIEERVLLTGPLDATRYRDWIVRSDLAVQLRRDFNGEASAATAECLSAGRPTVVSNLGWFRELPDDVVCKVPLTISPSGLAGVLDELLANEQRRRSLGDRARAYAQHYSFEFVAQWLRDLIERESR